MLQRFIEGIYMPHGYCLLWEPWLVTLHAGSDLLTFGAYSAIPLAIWMFLRERPNIEMRGLAVLFAAFILWCGLTHLFNVITLWHPIYELQGLVKAATAAISVTTAILIFPLIPRALAIPSPNELQIANAELGREILAHKETLTQLQRARAELEENVAIRTKDLAEATERFKALFEHAPVAMLIIDRTGAVQEINGAAEQVFACSRQALLGQPVETLLPVPLRQHHPKLREEYVSHPTARPMGAGRELFALRHDGEQFPVEIGLNPLPGADRQTVIASIVDISSRRKEEERMQIIMRELSHRSKNLLAVIQGMVRQAIVASPDMPTFERSFSERLQGLARSHDLLVGRNWEGAPIGGLVRAQLAFLMREDTSSVTIEGPDIVLTPEAAQALGLALHELATNAAKHGAFASSTGAISVSWHIAGQGGEAHVEFRWQEENGLATERPGRSGFGRTVLERVVPATLGGTASLEFRDGKVCWLLQAPLSALTKKAIQEAA
jgi:PAS domain S-box-containing protein